MDWIRARNTKSQVHPPINLTIKLGDMVKFSDWGKNIILNVEIPIKWLFFIGKTFGEQVSVNKKRNGESQWTYSFT